MKEKLPPFSDTAEKAVLGACLWHNELIDEVVPILPRPEIFYWAGHRFIYAAILARWGRGEAIDGRLVAIDTNAKQGADVSPALIGQCLDAPASAGSVCLYARKIRDTATRRALTHAGAKIERDAQAGSIPAEQLLESAEKAIFTIAEAGVEAQTISLADSLNELQKIIDARFMGKDKSGVRTGLVDLDNILGGLCNGAMYIIAARTSIGKTAFALTCAWHAARSGIPVLIFSLEQSHLELSERLLVMQADVDGRQLRDGSLSAHDQERLVPAADAIHGLPIVIDDAAGQNMLRIAATARREKRRRGIGLVLIDYLQLITPDDRRVNRQEQVATISHRVKNLARELAVPVVTLAQLNRESEKRQGGEPRLSDIRESDAIAQDADVAILLSKPERNAAGPGEIVEAKIAKHRNGPTGVATLIFRKASMRFENAMPDVWAKPFSESAAERFRSAAAE